MTYKIGDRMQETFLPPIIDDYVSPEDPVRVYDAFVEALDFGALGIPLEVVKAGADEYYPKDMLKLIIYGYAYGVRSSRKLERACHHNVSFMWLMGGLKPDYRTIARFRSQHKEAIKKVLKQCVQLCLKLDLIASNTLFVDGSPFRANASIRNTWTQERCQKHLDKIYQHIERLVEESEHLDETEENQSSLVKINQELQNQEQLKQKIQEIADSLQETSQPLHNTTDPDCVTTKGRQGTHAGYNAQVVVDEKNGLIVHTEAVSHSIDYNEFSQQVSKAGEALGNKPKIVSGDCGYYSLDDLDKVDKDITVIIPSINQAQKEKGLHPLKPFGKEQFQYDQENDQYICPAGKRLKYTCSTTPRKRMYQAKDCRACRFYGICTKSRSGRIIIRMLEENLQEKLKTIYHSPLGQAVYKLRQQKVELPFGHLKRNLSAGQFLLKGREKVNAELSILSTCFNIARMITLIGIPSLLLKLNES